MQHEPFLTRYQNRYVPPIHSLSPGLYFAVVHGSFHKPEHLGQAHGFPMVAIQAENRAVNETSVTFTVPNRDGIRRLIAWLYSTDKSHVANGTILYLKKMYFRSNPNLAPKEK